MKIRSFGNKELWYETDLSLDDKPISSVKYLLGSHRNMGLYEQFID